MVQKADRARQVTGSPGAGKSLLVEAIAYLSVIQHELESRYPMDSPRPEWIAQAYQEIEEAKEEIQNLLESEQDLAEVAVEQYETELENARLEAQKILWDKVGKPIPPEDLE